jgi:Protein of unknown function (DUF3179)
VWKRTVAGKVLRFHLAGINNQNFLMRDEETGSWWQQITGKAIFGPMKGAQLDPVLSDELTYATWKDEQSQGQVLLPVAVDAKEYESDWEPHVAKLPSVISFPGTPLHSRDVVVGMEIAGVSRAYPMSAILAESPVQDRLGAQSIVLVAGPDGKSVRAFISIAKGQGIELFSNGDAGQWSLTDSSTASQWNFQGCATSGPMTGECLQELPALKDYWFDWRNYHPNTGVYKR